MYHLFFCAIAAVQRKYESLRKNYHLEEKENSEEIVMEANKKKKYLSRRQRVKPMFYI